MRYRRFLAVRLWLRAVLTGLVTVLCPGLHRLLLENEQLRRDNLRLMEKVLGMEKDIHGLQSQRAYLLDGAAQLQRELDAAHTTRHDLLNTIDQLGQQQPKFH